MPRKGRTVVIVSGLLLALASVSFSTASNPSLFTSTQVKRENSETELSAAEEITDFSHLSEISESDPDFKAVFTSSSSVSYGQSFTLTLRNGGTKNYMLGYYGSQVNGTDEDYPLTVQYQYTTKSGNTLTDTTTIAKASLTNPYDGIGPTISDDNISYSICLPLKEEGVVDRSSLIIYNIFEATRGEDKADGTKGDWNVNLDKPYKITSESYRFNSKAKENLDLSSCISAGMDSYSHFGDYVTLNIEINNLLQDKFLADLREKLEDETAKDPDGEYKGYITGVNEGKNILRYTFYGITSSYFFFRYEDDRIETRKVEIKSASNIVLQNGNHGYNFLLEGVDTNGLIGVYLCNPVIHASVVSNQSSKDINGTSINYSLGALYFKPKTTPVSEPNEVFNTILTFVISSLVFIALAILDYFYRRNRFKNDEFRRVNNKSYLKTAILGYVTFEILLMDIFFIILRSTSLRNDLIVYNPVDNYIVILSILGILFGGYFIKFFITAFKDHRARRESIRLKLTENNDSNDGTK